MSEGIKRSRNVLGAGSVPLAMTSSDFRVVASTYRPPVTGFVRVYWKVTQVRAQVTAAPPRVKLGWEAAWDEGTIAASVVCDAWYGQMELQCSAASLFAGFGEDDTAGGDYQVQATIVEGASGAQEFGTFTRHVAVNNGATAVIPVPGVNDGGHRAVQFWWSDCSQAGAQQSNLELFGRDWAGTEIQFARTGDTPATPAAFAPAVYIIHPSVKEVVIINRDPANVQNGLLTFLYFGV